jgi:hypothetical protein
MGEYRIAGNRIQSRKLGECRTDDPACTKRLDAIRSWQLSSARVLFEATLAKDGVLLGLKWTAWHNSTTPKPSPDLDHFVVIADNDK